MKFYNNYSHIIAIGESSGGNDSVGDMWLEAKVFEKTTKIEEIIDWANNRDISGKLIITISEPEEELV